MDFTEFIPWYLGYFGGDDGSSLASRLPHIQLKFESIVATEDDVFCRFCLRTSCFPTAIGVLLLPLLTLLPQSLLTAGQLLPAYSPHSV